MLELWDILNTGFFKLFTARSWLLLPTPAFATGTVVAGTGRNGLLACCILVTGKQVAGTSPLPRMITLRTVWGTVRSTPAISKLEITPTEYLLA